MRRWWLETMIGVVAGGCAVASVLLGPPFADSDPAVAFALAVPAGLLLGAVTHWPWPVLAAEALLLVAADTFAPFGTDTAQVALSIALGVVAYRTAWPATLTGLAVTFAATLVNVVDPGNDAVLAGPSGALRAVALIGIASAPVAFGRYLRGVREAAAVARERAREAEAAQEMRLRAARLAERTALARDLHDILAHHVGAMALQSGAALYSARRSGNADEAIEALDAVRGTSVRVLDELRALLGVLRDPDVLDAPATEPERAMDDAVDRMRAAGLDVSAEIDDVAAAPLVVRTTAVRIVQEGLTNSAKHAGPGASVRVRVRLDDGEVRVTVTDDGPPGPPPRLPGAGQGLIGLRERVALLGGALTAGPERAGWRLDAGLPIEEKA